MARKRHRVSAKKKSPCAGCGPALSDNDARVKTQKGIVYGAVAGLIIGLGLGEGLNDPHFFKIGPGGGKAALEFLKMYAASKGVDPSVFNGIGLVGEPAGAPVHPPPPPGLRVGDSLVPFGLPLPVFKNALRSLGVMPAQLAQAVSARASWLKSQKRKSKGSKRAAAEAPAPSAEPTPEPVQ